MTYLVFAMTFLFAILLIFVQGDRRRRKAEKEFENKCKERFIELNQKTYLAERKISWNGFYLRHPKEGQLDDITWNDLGMDALFQRMNYTLSASGEEYLYYTLRTPVKEKRESEALEAMIQHFDANPGDRVQVQGLMKRLGFTGKHSLYDYLEQLESLEEDRGRRHLFVDFLYLLFVLLAFFQFAVGITGIFLLMGYQIYTYFKGKHAIDPYITSFAYVFRLLKTTEKLERLDLPFAEGKKENYKECRSVMKQMQRRSFWVMSPLRGQSSMDVFSVVMDYLRMVFHLDLICFYRMLRILKGHLQEVDALMEEVGFLETAIAIWIFRQSLSEGYCIPEFGNSLEIAMKGGYHPLLEQPVKNSIYAKGGILLTGSNASGKSTFLRCVAINAILAQSIHTCAATYYCAPWFRIMTSMSLRDNLESGESFFLVEIKAIKRICDAARGACPVLCVVDEVLRGTNTVERIAASSQILNYLSKENAIVFAATHDVELTTLLEGEFENYHFAEEVRDGDVFFSYRLQEGPASTKNAIRLLEEMGYADEITKNARRQAEEFLENGRWNVVR